MTTSNLKEIQREVVQKSHFLSVLLMTVSAFKGFATDYQTYFEHRNELFFWGDSSTGFVHIGHINFVSKDLVGIRMILGFIKN